MYFLLIASNLLLAELFYKMIILVLIPEINHINFLLGWEEQVEDFIELRKLGNSTSTLGLTRKQKDLGRGNFVEGLIMRSWRNWEEWIFELDETL